MEGKRGNGFNIGGLYMKIKDLNDKGIKIIRKEGNRTYFSCGCVTDLIGKNFIIKPCSTECELYQYVINRTKEMGKDLVFSNSRDMR